MKVLKKENQALDNRFPNNWRIRLVISNPAGMKIEMETSISKELARQLQDILNKEMKID